MWTGGERVVKAWISRNLGPVVRIEGVGRAAMTLSDVISDTAQWVRRAMVRLDEEGSKQSEVLARHAQAEKSRAIWSTLALWMIAIGALVTAFR